MTVRLSELNCKEVICISSGQRLGFVSDVKICLPKGEVVALLVPGPGKMMGFLGRCEDYVIPFDCIKKIGPDIILVDIVPEECLCARPRFLPGL
jgi:YlmC/YmxH family sporulation protein